jgi:undecaprenyl diphosphate synthase
MPVRHLGIIVDGNRRWATAQGLPASAGHKQGYENLKAIGLAALDRGVEHLTAYLFSTENWKRSQEEVGFLMDLMLFALTKELDFFVSHDVRLRIVGDKAGFSPAIQEAMAIAEQATAGCTRGQLNICVNYGGRVDIVHAVRQLVADGVRAEDVTEEAVTSRLWTAGLPAPDLILRTSGEQRLSNFLAWDGVYSELLFVDKNFPEFTPADLDAALAEFERRERRFGA